MILSASLLCFALAGFGSDTIPPVAVASRVRALLAERWSLPGERLTLSWGRLPADTSQLAEASLRFGAAPDRDGWTVVILEPLGRAPASVRLRVGTMTATAVTSRALDPGHILSRADIAVVQRVRWGAPDTTETHLAIGWEVRRPLRAGDPLLAAAIAPPVGARAGEPLTFFWQHGLVQVEIEAVALGTARLGEVARGRSGSTRYSGILTAPGIARLEARTP